MNNELIELDYKEIETEYLKKYPEHEEYLEKVKTVLNKIKLGCKLDKNIRWQSIASLKVVAGGFANRLYNKIPVTEGDVDIFTYTYEDYKNVIEILAPLSIDKLTKSKTARTFIFDDMKFQHVSRNFYNIEAIFSNFDFTISCFATDLNKIWTIPEAIRDCKTKRLNNSSWPCVFYKSRFTKFELQGYRLGPRLYKQFLFHCWRKSNAVKLPPKSNKPFRIINGEARY